MARLAIVLLSLLIAFWLNNGSLRADNTAPSVSDKTAPSVSDDTARAETFSVEEICPNAEVKDASGKKEIGYKEVCAILTIVKDTLESVSEAIKDYKPELSSIELNLNTALTKSKGAGINLIIISFGLNKSVYVINNTNFILKRLDFSGPKPKKRNGKDKKWVSKSLASVIVATLKALNESTVKPGWAPNSLRASAEFGVSRGSNVGVDTISLYPISFNGRSGRNFKFAQQIIFNFGAEDECEDEDKEP